MSIRSKLVFCISKEITEKCAGITVIRLLEISFEFFFRILQNFIFADKYGINPLTQISKSNQSKMFRVSFILTINLQGYLFTGGLVITPRQGVAITPSSRKILCGNDFYKTKYSEIFRIQQKAIFADLTFITPSCRNWSGKDFYKNQVRKFGIFLRV